MTKTIGHKYTPVKELKLKNLVDFKEHHRLQVFYHKGTKCTGYGCNRVGTRLIVGQQKNGSKHVDVYTEDLVLMTIDHILPKSKGGSNDLSNLAPMCTHCNSKKGNKIL